MVKLWFCWIFFVLFFNKVVGENEAGEEAFNVGDVTVEPFLFTQTVAAHENTNDKLTNMDIPSQRRDKPNDDYNQDYANKENDEGDKATSEEINLPRECPPDPFINKCPKECQVIIDDRGCSLCVCTSNHKTHDSEEDEIGVKLQHSEPIDKDFDIDHNQMQLFFEPSPAEHNQSQQTSDAVSSDEVDALQECPPDPFKNKCSKECQVINDDRGCSLCVCPSNHKTHNFEPHQSQSEVVEIHNVSPTQILSENWSNLFLNRNFTFTEKSDEINKSSNFEILFDKEQSAAENETKSEVVEKTYSSINENDPNTIANEILSKELAFEEGVIVDVRGLFESVEFSSDNETNGINNIIFENGIDENHGHNETNNNKIQEGSSSIDDEIFAEGNTDQKISIDDENGDVEDSEVAVFEENPTVEQKPKMNEMHKCLCSEIETCLTEVWGNEIFNYKETSDVNLLTKCSLTFLKNDCSNSFNSEKKLIFANENSDDKIDTCLCTSDSIPFLFNKQMEKCMTKKSCFIQNHELIFKKMRPFCIEKVKKLAVLNSLKFSKDEIFALKNEYLQTFDEEFEDAAKPRYSNIFSRWFYQMRNKFCETF